MLSKTYYVYYYYDALSLPPIITTMHYHSPLALMHQVLGVLLCAIRYFLGHDLFFLQAFLVDFLWIQVFPYIQFTLSVSSSDYKFII